MHNYSLATISKEPYAQLFQTSREKMPLYMNAIDHDSFVADLLTETALI
jgi:hypothetical protein